MANITKEEIIRNTVSLFNRYGITTVSMRDIAEACGISVGNLTYHFHRKKDLILTIIEQHQEERKQYPSAVNMGFIEFMEYVEKAEELRIAYSFYYDNFVDISRLYKEVAIIQRRVHQEVIDYLKKALYSFEKKGLFQPEHYPNNYSDMANGLIMITSFWGHHVALTDRGPQEYAYLKNVLWSILVPCMTELGFQEYIEKIVPRL